MSGNAADEKSDDLMKRAKSGDQEAFVALVANHEQVIHHVVGDFIHNIRGYEEHDLVNEVILRAYQRIPEFHGDEVAFQYFLRRTARGICLNIIKKQGRAHQETENVRKHTYHAPVRPDERYLSEKIWECVQKAISLLPEKLRKVVLLISIEGFAYKETVEILGIEEGTVKSRLNRGKEQLRRLLEELHCVEML